MENEFSKVMSERSDEQLIKIVTSERDKYQPLAIEAAEAEIEKRNIDSSTFDEIRETATIEREKQEEVDEGLAPLGLRFVNCIVDIFAAYIVVWGTIFVAAIILPFVEHPVVFTILMLGSWFAYYAIMELLFQKTLGKILTRTRVVKLNGDRPGQGEIVVRTFIRFVPFDAITYLFMTHGLHDALSKTKVIRDSSVK